MKGFSAACAAAVLVLSGCSAHELWWGKQRPSVGYTFLRDEGRRDGIYAWRPDAAAAVAAPSYVRDPKGYLVKHPGRDEYLYEQRTCVLSAAAIKSRDAEGGLTVEVDAPQGATSGEIGAIAREIQRINMLGSKNEAATFLDVALFNICIASLNGMVSDGDAKTLIADALARATEIGKAEQDAKIRALGASTGSPASSTVIAPVKPGAQVATPANPGLPAKPKVDPAEE